MKQVEDTPLKLRSAISVLMDRLAYLRDRVDALEPGYGSWHYVRTEIRALETAISIMLHEASVREEGKPRIREAYGVGRLPMAAV